MGNMIMKQIHRACTARWHTNVRNVILPLKQAAIFQFFESIWLWCFTKFDKQVFFTALHHDGQCGPLVPEIKKKAFNSIRAFVTAWAYSPGFLGSFPHVFWAALGELPDIISPLTRAKFEQTPLFYPHCWAVHLWGIAPMATLPGWLPVEMFCFFAHESWLYRAAPIGVIIVLNHFKGF